MSSVEEITEAIRRLSANDRWNLLHRFSDEHHRQHRLLKVEQSNSGAQSSLVAEAKSEILAGATRPLHEILRDE